MCHNIATFKDVSAQIYKNKFNFYGGLLLCLPGYVLSMFYLLQYESKFHKQPTHISGIDDEHKRPGPLVYSRWM